MISKMTNVFLVAVFLLHFIATFSPTDALQSSSLLTNTQWKVQLDVGLQPGTWMPKRHPGWAESGARLLVDADIKFSDTASSARESLVGPKDMTYVLEVCGGPSSFVSEKGEQKVTFTSGGWCIQRPTNDIRNAEGNRVKPEGLLRFWLDCPSGAKRRDVEIFPNTRIFFTTGVWDNPAELESLEKEYETILTKMEPLVENTRESKALRKNNDGSNFLDQALDFRNLVRDAEEFERLKNRKEELERASPPKSASRMASTGVTIAPTGSLVIKGNKIPDWLPGSEYLILGTFSTKPLE